MIAGHVSLGLEYDLRERLYGHLQRLELGFFDHQQTGQLMSRATVDLQAVRFFLGYGLVFILQSILTIVLAGAVMLAVNPSLGADRAGAGAVRGGDLPALWQARASCDPGGAAAHRRADGGCGGEHLGGARGEVLRARASPAGSAFAAAAARVFDQSMVATRLEATYNPIIGFLPQLGLAAVLLIGGEAVIHAHLTLGQFTSFYLYLNMLIGADALAGRDARPGAARDGLGRAHLPAARPRAAPERAARRAGAAGRQRQRAVARGDAALRGSADEFGATGLG